MSFDIDNRLIPNKTSDVWIITQQNMYFSGIWVEQV